MSVNKSKLHELIDLISEDKIEEVVIILQDYIEKREARNLFSELLKNPIKVNKAKRFSREELYEG
ncbi:MAG: hypothetical protein A2Y25_00035 [Candidatus Melainabacteria bacterium GWF2_37_15]|nr:MAG: hypothetical protein A2Y25_00035 [Candidatus Melainabacteria bacterium GWF2_37_15]